MTKRLLIVFVAVVALAISSGAMANGPVTLDLSPYEHYYQGEIIEVPPGDIETLWFHIDDGGLGGYYHVDYVSFHWNATDPGANVSLVDQMVQTSIEYQASTWYQFGVIKVDGPPSTMVTIQIDLTLPLPTGNIFSNTITKHITPEPSSMLALGTGLFGLGGLLLKRRRK